MRFVALALLAACSLPNPALAPGGVLPEAPEDAAAADTASDAIEEVPSCSARVVWLTPRETDGSAPIDGVVRAGFSEPVHALAWDLSLVGVPGVAMLDKDGMAASFVPDVPLASERPYQIEASVCGGLLAGTFTTGGPQVAPERLHGKRWLVDLDAGTWLAPNIAPLLAPLLDLGHVLLLAETDPSLRVSLRAWSTEPDADADALSCDDDYPVGVLDLSENPAFRTVNALTASTPRRTRLLDDLQVEGQLAPGGDGLDDLVVAARLDVGLVQRLTGVIDVCALVRSMGDQCVPCSDGSSTCLEVVVTDLQSSEAGSVLTSSLPPTCEDPAGP